MPRSSPAPSPAPRVRALLVLLLALFPAIAGAREILRPSLLNSRVEAGSVVTIRWPALPDGFEEAEVLLSVDDGRRYVLRASPELDGRERGCVWRVPNLATPRARLRLRARLDGREVLLEESAPFEIAGGAGTTSASWQLEEATWWNGPHADHAEAAPAALGGRQDEWSVATAAATAGTTPPRTVPLVEGPAPRIDPRIAPAADRAPSTSCIAPLPRFIPPRK